jgi:hypothetical protein
METRSFYFVQFEWEQKYYLIPQMPYAEQLEWNWQFTDRVWRHENKQVLQEEAVDGEYSIL